MQQRDAAACAMLHITRQIRWDMHYPIHIHALQRVCCLATVEHLLTYFQTRRSFEHAHQLP